MSARNKTNTRPEKRIPVRSTAGLCAGVRIVESLHVMRLCGHETEHPMRLRKQVLKLAALQTTRCRECATEYDLAPEGSA